MYAQILNARLETWVENNNILCDAQNGLRKDRSCLDHIYLLQSILSNRKMSKKDTFVCFIDAKKAFDTVDRDCLWFKLLKIGIHGDFLKAVQSLYKSVSCTVKINNNFTEWFKVNMGVKQGCVLSPTLFSVYVIDLANEINNLRCGVSFDDINISILLYADGIALITPNEMALQRMLNVLLEWSYKWRININEKKTKALQFRHATKRRSHFVFKCGDKHIHFEAFYKYLGFWFHEPLDMKKSIKEISKAASRSFGAVFMKYISCGGMAYNVYSKLVDSVVEPVLFYCSGIWGHNRYSEIDEVLNRACSMYLGVSKNAPNTSCRWDMGWFSCEVKQKIDIVRLWCRQRNMPENRLVKHIHNYH